MPASSLSDIANLIRTHADLFRDSAHERFFVEHLEARNVFPLRTQESHLDLAPTIAWTIENSSPGHLSEPVRQHVRALGLDHRRHGFPPEAYATFAHNMQRALRDVLSAAGEPYTPAAQQAEELIESACAEMAGIASEADLAGMPPAFTGEVISVNRTCRRISTVTLDIGLGIPFEAGQYLLTTTPMLPGIWLPMAPASPPNEFGQVEFHVFANEGGAAQRLSHTQVGDHWTFSQPYGGFNVDYSHDLLLIAHSTGWAPLRSILFEIMMQPEKPQVTVIINAEYPGELYELTTLMALAQASSWLTVIPSAANIHDAWWVAPTSPTPHIYIAKSDNPGELAVSRGAWLRHDVLVAGPTDQVTRSIAALEAAGCTSIQSQPW